MQNVLGYSPEEIIGKMVIELLAPAEAEKMGDAFSDMGTNIEPIKDLEDWELPKTREDCALYQQCPPSVVNEGQSSGIVG